MVEMYGINQAFKHSTCSLEPLRKLLKCRVKSRNTESVGSFLKLSWLNVYMFVKYLFEFLEYCFISFKVNLLEPFRLIIDMFDGQLLLKVLRLRNKDVPNSVKTIQA